MSRALVLCLAAAVAAGCSNRPAGTATDAQIAAVSYRDSGPASLTLYTIVNNRTGKGAHSALLINASQRVMFDPAGSFHADRIPERGDVLYGMTPAAERAYRSAHARSTFRVEMQTVEVTPAQAEAAYRLAVSNGRVSGALCSNAAANLLVRVPGFETLRPTLYPSSLQAQFATLPGVRAETYSETDGDDLEQGIAQGNAGLNAAARNAGG